MSERIVGILLCAGSSQRMGFDKLTTPLCGKSAIERSMEALVQGGVTELIYAVSPATRAFASALPCPVPHHTVDGGATRQRSVQNALLSATGDLAVIHDAARCLVRPETVAACIESARRFGSGVAARAVTDTVLRQEGGKAVPVPRDGLFRMQTPQVFRYAEIAESYINADEAATDDCTLYVRSGCTPHFVETSGENLKLTTREDWAQACLLLTPYGTGFDTHRLVPGRRLVLGGVDIPFETGLLGHSDADVLTHAIMDALLCAASLPDIGHLFPDSDPATEGVSSITLLRRVAACIAERGLKPAHVSATVIAERPRLSPYLDGIRANLAEACGLPVSEVAVAATTTEGMNDEGRGLCISVQAVASVR